MTSMASSEYGTRRILIARSDVQHASWRIHLSVARAPDGQNSRKKQNKNKTTDGALPSRRSFLSSSLFFFCVVQRALSRSAVESTYREAARGRDSRGAEDGRGATKGGGEHLHSMCVGSHARPSRRVEVVMSHWVCSLYT